MFPSYGFGTLPGVEDRRTPNTSAVIVLDEDKVPGTFPMMLWQQQATRYVEYWRWFNGDILNEKRARTKEGKEVYKYPLGINPVRNFARKHAAFLLGEEAFDTPRPLVKTLVTPKSSLDGSEFDEEDKKLADLAERVIDTVWIDSNGRAIQQENAELQQFLGGCVFQLCWQPWRSDELQIPVTIKGWPVDFFLPVWDASDPWNLLEAFIIYRIPAYVANEMYGYERESGTGFYIYCEHWTRKSYSVYLDGNPLKSEFSGTEVTYKDLPNPFGFVPFVYIPHLREGNFFGSSIVEDIRGLVRELNARAADLGDAVRDTVHRRRYVTDLEGSAKPAELGKGVLAINLGRTSMTTKAKPEVKMEDAMVLSDGQTDQPEKLWRMLLREGNMGDMPFGEDEGSQRSALTLAFRMWPSTSHARAERTFWTEGMNTIAKMILKIVFIKQKEIPSLKNAIPKDFLRRLQFNPDWLPMIPRDREQAVNEVILRFQSGLLSPQLALNMLGDVDYIDDEIKNIMKWQVFQAELAAAGKPASGEDGKSGGGAQTIMQTPIVTDGLGAND